MVSGGLAHSRTFVWTGERPDVCAGVGASVAVAPAYESQNLTGDETMTFFARISTFNFPAFTIIKYNRYEFH